MSVHKCECEHISHFDRHSHQHDRDRLFDNLIRVETDYGVYAVCEDCRTSHLAAYPDARSTQRTDRKMGTGAICVVRCVTVGQGSNAWQEELQLSNEDLEMIAKLRPGLTVAQWIKACAENDLEAMTTELGR